MSENVLPCLRKSASVRNRLLMSANVSKTSKMSVFVRHVFFYLTWVVKRIIIRICWKWPSRNEPMEGKKAEEWWIWHLQKLQSIVVLTAWMSHWKFCQQQFQQAQNTDEIRVLPSAQCVSQWSVTNLDLLALSACEMFFMTHDWWKCAHAKSTHVWNEENITLWIPVRDMTRWWQEDHVLGIMQLSVCLTTDAWFLCLLSNIFLALSWPTNSIECKRFHTWCDVGWRAPHF